LTDLDQMIEWGQEVIKLMRQAFERNPGYFTYFATIRSNYLSLVRADGALDLYHGGLRAKNGAVVRCLTISIISAISRLSTSR
jgi:NAD-reducing hydrogenase large subunit